MRLPHLSGTLLLAAGLHGTVAAQTDTVPTDTLRPDPTQDAYLDETARRLVLGARAARDTSRLAIDSYTAVIRERLAIETPAFRRGRLWMNGERAVRVRWSGDEPNIVHVLGARLRDRTFGPGEPEYFSGLRAERFAADPLGDPFNFGLALFVGEPDARAIVLSPLQADSERYYQFRSGDTITVTLGGGGLVRAVAVTAVPRYRDIRLLSAIIWIEPESFGLARVAYRLAKKVDRELSWHLRRGGRWSPGLVVRTEADDTLASPDSLDDRPRLFDRIVNGVFNQSFPPLEMDVSAVVADYGLWGMQHWLPRSVVWQGHMVGSEGVSASGEPPPAVPVTIGWTLEVEDIRERGEDATAGMPATALEALELWSQEGDSIAGEVDSEEPADVVTITPADREALAASDLLPPALWAVEGEADRARLAETASTLAAIGTGEGRDASDGASPWIFHPPGKTLRLLRYNPVERMSVGTRLRGVFGWGSAELTTRIATARLALPDIDLTLLHDHSRGRTLVSFYRSLRGSNPGGRTGGPPAPYATGDLSDFHWSHGAAVRFLPSAGQRTWLSLRLFAEQDAELGRDATRNRVGAAVAWRPWWGGIEYGSVGGGGRASVRASAGDNPHVRAVAEGALVVPLPARMSLGMQAGMAQVWGDPAAHDLWRIGNTGAWLRGHAAPITASRIHMARMDLQRPIRFLRVSLFGDWASAGGEDFYAVGAGLSLMSGMMRVDVAQGLRRGRAGAPDAVVRVHVLADAFF